MKYTVTLQTKLYSKVTVDIPVSDSISATKIARSQFLEKLAEVGILATEENIEVIESRMAAQGTPVEMRR